MADTLRIVIIEDDADTRANLRDILQLDSHAVTVHGTVADACEDPDLGLADVLIMDRKLPDGFAEELLPKIKVFVNDCDIIVITGFADMHATIAAMREGVSDYLIKPIDPEALRASLARIASHRRLASELYRQRRFAEMLLETAEAVVLVLDLEGRIKRVNPYLLELTGWSLEEVIDRDWFAKFVPERHRGRIRKVFGDTLRFNSRGIVNPVLTRSGKEREIRWSNKALRAADGSATAVLCVGLDVTDYMAAQKRLVQNERLAAIGETMAGVAHESRNALQRLQNSVELLQDELAEEPVLLEDLAKVERAGKHIRDLLEEVREYAAPIQLARQQESVAVVWRRAWESLSGKMGPVGAELVESFVPAEAATDCAASVDTRRLEQVFRNVFENALDAKPSGLIVEIICRASPEQLTIEMSDNGNGVPDSHRDTLFEAFATSKPTGTGLGLAICRRVVEAHGGTIELLDSDQGARFALMLPRMRPSERACAV